MSDIRVVLLLLALCPGVGLAQSAEPVPPPPLVEVEDAPAPAPVEAEPAPRALTAAAPVPLPPTQVAKAERPPVPVVGRVFVESLAGSLVGVGGGFVGLGGSLVLGGSLGGCGGPCGVPNALMGGMLVGFSLGAATGVYFSGSMMGGQGRLWPTLGLGLLAGGAATALYVGDVAREGALPVLFAAPLVLSVLTYEVSSGWVPEGGPGASVAARGTGAWWTPTVGVSGRGGSLGLAGRF